MNFTRDLSLGSFGKDVYDLQIALELLGYGDFVPIGVFGPKTLNAVIKFQISNNITPVAGYFGPKTRTKMFEILSKKKREVIYATAISCLGVDVTPDDIVSDEYDCADTVTTIVKRALGAFPEGSISTYSMYRSLLTSTSFIRVDTPLEGDILISPTGYGNGKLSNGHVSIMGKEGKIMSNSSSTGLFTQNYTLETWRNRYVDIGGYPMMYFRAK